MGRKALVNFAMEGKNEQEQWAEVGRFHRFFHPEASEPSRLSPNQAY